MKNLELNKIAAAVIVAGLIAMVAGKIADFLYHPEKEVEVRGFSVDTSDMAAASGGEVKKAEILFGQLMAAASIEDGAKLSKKCVSCHSFEKGGPNKVGPNLWGVLGANKASHAGFNYSNALKETASTDGAKWNYENLYHFLKSPAKYAKGTKMSFAGLRKPEDIANIIAYMRQQGSSSTSLPPADMIIE